MIAVRSWERAKGLTRIDFVAGGRALADYRRANKSAREIGALFSTGRDEASELAVRLIEENKQLHRLVRALEEISASVEAEKLIAAVQVEPDGTRIVSQTFAGRDADSLKKLAHALIAHPKTIVLLGSSDKENARLVFARSEDAVGDMNALMRAACIQLDGRGGGKADMAQGGGKNIGQLEEVLEALRRICEPPPDPGALDAVIDDIP
jgi:alanyl-tRNA synthetase